MGTALKCRIRDFNDFAIWYTPGVAAVCKEIAVDKQKAYEYTNKWNSVAVISDGTRVLGLGDIGPEAGLPVMEGKGILYKYLGGVDAFPICLDEKDPDKIIEIGRALQPSFGGFNLEDISSPSASDPRRAAREVRDPGLARRPAGHGLRHRGRPDQRPQDRQEEHRRGQDHRRRGRRVGHQHRPPDHAGRGQRGQHALRRLEGHPVRDRADRENLQKNFKEKWTCVSGRTPRQAGADPGRHRRRRRPRLRLHPRTRTIKPEWVKTMAKDAIVFAEANPIPEIWPWEAKEAGARIVATGRSDFPTRSTTPWASRDLPRGPRRPGQDDHRRHCIAAARELAKVAEDKGIHEEYIIPTWTNGRSSPRSRGRRHQAIEEGVARFNIPADVRFKMAEEIIRASREDVQKKMREGVIIDPDK